jgi:hypothetical protein
VTRLILRYLAVGLLAPSVLLVLAAAFLALPGAGLLALAAYRHSAVLRRQCASYRSQMSQWADSRPRQRPVPAVPPAVHLPHPQPPERPAGGQLRPSAARRPAVLRPGKEGTC